MANRFQCNIEPKVVLKLVLIMPLKQMGQKPLKLDRRLPVREVMEVVSGTYHS
jgi:hypothetical protein